MVKINNDLMNETPATLWYDDKINPPVEVGVIKNTIAFNDVRLQITKEKSDNYHVIFEGVQIDINSDGRLHHWPAGMFNLLDSQLCELIHLNEPVKELKPCSCVNGDSLLLRHTLTK